MKCRMFNFLLIGVLAIGASKFSIAENQQTEKVSSAKKKKVKKTKKLAKKTKKKSKKAKRKLASESDSITSMVVFSENTNFEKLVTKAESVERELASQGVSARVIGVRRELGLDDAESTRSPVNIILNAGKNKGIDQGMTLKVIRKIPIIDPYHENRQADLEVEFGSLKVLHAQDNIAVAKIEKIDGLTRGLYVGTRGILIGDFVRE